MKVKILGCSGGTAPGGRTSCYAINDRFFIDAGCIASVPTIDEQRKITDIVITHPHIDHIKDLCFLIENTFSPDRSPLMIHSTKEILDDIHRHLFNNVLWPDFSQIYVDAQKKKTLLIFKEIQTSVEIGGVKITPIPVHHTGHAVGYILDDGKAQLVFSGDTGTTQQLWAEASRCKNLVGVFTEVSFPNRFESLAKASGHFTSQHMLTDIHKLVQKSVPVYIAHFKPPFFEELMKEFHQLSPQRFHLLHQEDEIVF